MEKIITQCFHTSAEIKRQLADVLAPDIARGAQILINALNAGRHVLACGNGGSACDAQHLAAELVNRFETERRALPAMALTTDSAILTSVANDLSYLDIFSRQIQAWGGRDDVLVAISTSGKSPNVLRAVSVARERDMRVIALSGRDGGDFPGLLSDHDVEVRVVADQTARIQEVHLLVIHCFCTIIDEHFKN